MEMRAEAVIAVTPERAWQVVGERFGQVAQWATPILTSRLVADLRGPAGAAAPAVPAVGVARACGIGGFGPFPAGEIVELLTLFDPAARRLEYRAERGMPRMVRSAVNRWSVHPALNGGSGSVVRVHATLTLAWWAAPVGPFLAWQLRRGARDVLEDLRHYTQTGRPRPGGRPVRGAAV